jgi:hypothetical protein
MKDSFTKEDLEKGLRALSSMIGKVEKAVAQFAQGTSQYTLQKNRFEALKIASSLISKELVKSDPPRFEKEELENSIAPIASLISKSEKARQKLAPDGWQHRMLSDNLKALYIALSLLKKALGG